MSPRTSPQPMDERQLVTLITDNETGLLNDAYFRLRLEEEFKKSWRFQWSYSLVLVDIEGLDSIEQTEGTSAADSTILDIAGELLTASRDVDLSARLGRSRFAALLPGTGTEGAVTMVRRVLHGVLQKVEERVGLAVGISTAPQDKLASPDEFFARAEQALHMAHAQGSNQVVTWNAPAR
ncbi:MAG TPA: GGDEF domain-containing protein [Planctomycetota bacterium]|nr:GGDEF domain-containing protein [Planctomycetota bacterium]